VDLTAGLLRFAARRPHVLVATAVGGTGARLAVEAALARQGWPSVGGPADADVLVVAGTPGPGLGPVVERIWRQIPAPRTRAAVDESGRVDRDLVAAAARLADVGHQRTSGRAENPQQEHGDGETDMPGGRPMAETGEDRDGLMLDRLHLPLGPVLPDWPAGLVLRLTLAGDVVQEAEVEVLDAGRGTPFWDRPERARARELDALARFLGVAGWADTAARARRLRDAALAGADVAGPTAELVRRVRRSRTLRWLVRDIAAGPVDVAVRLAERLSAVEVPDGAPPRPPAADLPELLAGAELAAARLVVAALDPDTEPDPEPDPATGRPTAVEPAPGEVGHG
jgi:hypothetical protein